MEDMLQDTPFSYVLFSFTLSTEQVIEILSNSHYELETHPHCKQFCKIKLGKELNKKQLSALHTLDIEVYSELSS